MKKYIMITLFLCSDISADIQDRTQRHIRHNDCASNYQTMHGMYGRYPMTREASGTSWVPDSSPPMGFHKMYKNWMFMFGGYSYLVFDVQGGKRGGKKIFDENMIMFMGQRDFNKTTFGFRTMFSLEPVTIGKCGYPLLLQTGETCDGITPLVDRQHPHDLFMELAIVGSHEFKKDLSGFLYFGLPGEPAIAPPVFMMRFSSEYIPQAPLGHHWMDSTHVTFGVLTTGLIYKNLKFECSAFKGREPDEDLFDIEKPKLDSYSFRLSYNPTENFALQASYAFLKSPEKLHPEVNTRRYVLSGIYNKQFDNSNVQTAAILGINNNKPGNLLPSFLLEATAEIRKKHMVFGRFETQNNDELFEEPSPFAEKIFNVNKLTLGYIYNFLFTRHLKWSIGGLIDFPFVPQKIKCSYGNTTSGMIFLQIRIV